eukprot:TRINITY_DN16_c3_g2_i1.p1 TRINITY_DN16_c3_g2~~TRINITY_DN16_c3_g2_i1.p1  ORF type:complete len:437 (+),score=117.78 TRINITY_DN16_c3_g2_i1:75-1385(+)
MNSIRSRLSHNNAVQPGVGTTGYGVGTTGYTTGGVGTAGYTTGTTLVQQPIVGSTLVGEQQLALQQQQFGLQKSIVSEPAQTVVAQPIVQETIRQDRVVEVQPIIHRDVERPVVNHIERHINEPAPMSRAGTVQHGAIVQETFHDRIVNEIQPVIHREVAIPQVEQVQQHYVEHIVANPQHTRQVVYEQIPSQMGQQFIQRGIGQQQFLPSGLVPASTIGYGTGFGQTGFSQQALIQQQQQQAFLQQQQVLLGDQFGINQRGGLLQQQQLLPQNYGATQILGTGGLPLNQTLGHATGLGQHAGYGISSNLGSHMAPNMLAGGQRGTLGAPLSTGFGQPLSGGLYNQGMNTGLYNQGLNSGLYNQGLNSGLYNQGLNSGLYNQGLNSGLYNQGLNSGLEGQQPFLTQAQYNQQLGQAPYNSQTAQQIATGLRQPSFN